jgi:enoyl-CoA hydratase/carnithine racemase
MDLLTREFKTVRLEIDEDRILRVTLHTNGGPLLFDLTAHAEWVELWPLIAAEDDIRLMILTGSGDAFTPPRPMPFGKDRASMYSPLIYHKLWRAGVEHIKRLLDIPVPVIAAVNGPARMHPEVALLSDIVIATPTAEFQDLPHFPEQIVPGDGMNVVMPMLMGKLRGSYFLFTGQKVGAAEAKDMGLINEIVEPERLLPRAYELAQILLRQPAHNLRYLRFLMTQHIKRRMHDEVPLGIAVEGLATLSNNWERWDTTPWTSS